MKSAARFGLGMFFSAMLLIGVLPIASAEIGDRGHSTAPGVPAEQLGFPDTFGGYTTTHILVRFAPGITPTLTPGQPAVGDPAIDRLIQTWGVTGIEPALPVPPRNAALADFYGLTRTYRFQVPPGTDTLKMAAQFSAAAGVEIAEVDGIGGVAATIPNDPAFVFLYAMNNIGQSGGIPDADIDAAEAWDIHTGTSNVLLAIIDTGVQADHPDLNGKVIPGYNTYDNNTDTADLHGHGTHVSGTAGAFGNNGVGVAGVSWGVTILAMRCLSPQGSGTESQCAAAIVWATDNGADIASMSLQYYTGTTLLRDAVAYAHDSGLVVIAASGNNAGHTVAYPARFPKCMGIGATNRSDAWASFSNWGPEVDVSAPGQSIYSTYKNSGYMTWDGTSMATPHVSGLAALLLSYNPSLTNERIEDILKTTAEDKGDAGFDEKFGWGRINAYQALLAADPRGDLNCDGITDFFDIDPFIQALLDPGGYAIAHAGCDISRADINGDGGVDFFDVDPFVTLILD